MSEGHRLRMILLAVLSALAMAGIATSRATQQDPPPDTNAMLQTHIPHRYIHIAGTVAETGSAEAQSVAASVFSEPPYATDTPVTPTTTAPEAEEHIAGLHESPVAVISDFALRGGFNTTKYVRSPESDGFAWLTDSYVPLDGSNFPITSDGQTWDANSHPVVAVGDASSNVYLANLYFNCSGCPHNNRANGLYVSVGNLFPFGNPTLGITAGSTRPVAANLSPTSSVFEGKEWIAVDNSASQFSGNVYVCWTRFTNNFSSDHIRFARSIDQGMTWINPPSIRISPRFQDGAVQGCQVAVGPAGDVYVVYEVFFRGGFGRHFLAKSTDGGVTFSFPLPITPFFRELSFSSTYPKHSFPALAVGANDFVYVVYADQNAGNAEVKFISGPGGSLFTRPVVVNDVSTGQHFMPAISVDGFFDNIHVSWFDTRLSPGGSTSMYDIFATYSCDKGANFAVNTRVTRNQVNATGATFIGFYAGIWANNDGFSLSGEAHPVWTSGGVTGPAAPTMATGGIGQLNTAHVGIPFNSTCP